jgi:hypothetical protein
LFSPIVLEEKMKNLCFIVTMFFLIALMIVPGCHPINAEQRSEYATEGAAFRVTLTYQAANPDWYKMPEPEEVFNTMQAEFAAYTPRPTETATPWPTITQVMPANAQSICLGIEQVFGEAQGTMPDPRPFAVCILENSGFSVMEPGAACDAGLDIQLTLTPLSESYLNLGGSGSSTCYTGAKASGNATLTASGQAPKSTEVSGIRSPTSGIFVIISECPGPSQAPFDVASKNAVFDAMLKLVGVRILDGAMLDEDAQVRSYAIWMIWDMFSQTGYNGSFDLLLMGLDDPIASVRSAAVTILGFMGEAADPAFDRLLAMLQDPDPEVRRGVIDSLDRIRQNDPTLIDPMITMLKDTDEDVAHSALFELDSIGREAERAVPAVLEYYQAHPNETYAVFTCLKAITGEDLGTDPQAWQAWWEGYQATPGQ